MRKRLKQDKNQEGTLGTGAGEASGLVRVSLSSPKGRTLKTKSELEGVGDTLSLCTDSWPSSFSLPLQKCVSTFLVPKNSPLYLGLE